MKQLLVLLAIIFISNTNSWGQKGLKLGAQFTPGVSMALNNQDFDKESTLDLEAAFAFNAGFIIGYGITEQFSITTGVSYLQHTASFVHNRATLSSGTPDPNYGKKFSRQANYVRVPLLFELSSDPNQTAGFLVRFGPHFDFLTSGRYKDARLEGFSGYDANKGIDMRQEVTIFQPNHATGGLLSTGRKGQIYKDFVLGATLEVGAQVYLTDAVKMTFLVHFEASSNPEGEGAASFAHNLAQGDYLVMSSPVFNPTTAAMDEVKANDEETPFDATFPNYPLNGDENTTLRSPTWSIMAGLHIGVVYTLKQ